MTAPKNLTLFYFPRACSLAAHIALEESGLQYERRIVDLRTHKNWNPEYLATNPSGAVPALSIGEATLTETHAILTYIGDHASSKNLLAPPGDLERYRAHEWMNFMSSSVHTYVRSIFRSSVYAGEDNDVIAAVYAQGVTNLAKAVAIVETRLTDLDWAAGSQFSVADAYLFVMYLWTTDERIASVPPRPNWKALAQRVWQRPAVQRVVALERRDRNYGIPWE
ncbi:MAG: glutathione S-transferase N-terminal domain-containing protein [Halioglobus sp.]|nr:glutathione S-transferase N-terminal domain-containing protein [Halioglobus sp.]MDE0929391.1 glutathione S-transferase N-terminal domain-containing protein [Halioglobus sp.]